MLLLVSSYELMFTLFKVYKNPTFVSCSPHSSLDKVYLLPHVVVKWKHIFYFQFKKISYLFQCWKKGGRFKRSFFFFNYFLQNTNIARLCRFIWFSVLCVFCGFFSLNFFFLPFYNRFKIPSSVLLTRYQQASLQPFLNPSPTSSSLMKFDSSNTNEIQILL